MNDHALPVHYCHDCTAAYKAEMMVEGRCSHPEVTFVDIKIWGGYETIGVRNPGAILASHASTD